LVPACPRRAGAQGSITDVLNPRGIPPIGLSLSFRHRPLSALIREPKLKDR